MFGIQIPHVLSLFPDLLTFGMLGIFFLRIAVGILFIRFGYVKLYVRKEQSLEFYKNMFPSLGKPIFATVAYVELFGGILMTIGLFTQAVALIFAFLMALATGIKIRHPESLRNDRSYYILIGIVCLSLLTLGAGAFAIDYPL